MATDKLRPQGLDLIHDIMSAVDKLAAQTRYAYAALAPGAADPPVGAPHPGDELAGVLRIQRVDGAVAVLARDEQGAYVWRALPMAVRS